MPDSDELEAHETIKGSEGAAVLRVRREGSPSLRFEFVEHGGKSLFSHQVSVAFLWLMNRFQATIASSRMLQ